MRQAWRITAQHVFSLWWHHMATLPCHKVSMTRLPMHFLLVRLKRGETTLTAAGRPQESYLHLLAIPQHRSQRHIKYLLPFPTTRPSLLLKVAWSHTELLTGAMSKDMSPPCLRQIYNKFGMRQKLHCGISLRSTQVRLSFPEGSA